MQLHKNDVISCHKSNWDVSVNTDRCSHITYFSRIRLLKGHRNSSEVTQLLVSHFCLAGGCPEIYFRLNEYILNYHLS